MKLIKLLEETGLSSKQAEVFLLLYRYGRKPASSVAKIIWQERTNVYKLLQSMVRKGIIAETNKEWVKHFFVADKNIFRHLHQKQKEDLDQIEKTLPLIETELSKFDERKISPMPKMRFFEGKSWINTLFDDMYNNILSNHYIMIKMFASNTLESQSTSPHNLHDYSQAFFDKLKWEWVSVEAYLWNGILMFENILKTYDVQELETLPAGNSTINIFILWNIVYIVIFKQVPFGLKIESEELASVLHFLLKQSYIKQN